MNFNSVFFLREKNNAYLYVIQFCFPILTFSPLNKNTYYSVPITAKKPQAMLCFKCLIHQLLVHPSTTFKITMQ